MPKKVIFEGYNINYGTTVTEERTFPDDATHEEIQEDYEQWAWELIGDYFSWNEE